MIKLVILLVSLIGSIITELLLPDIGVWLSILRILCLFIGYMIVQAFLFFFVVFLVGLPIKKHRDDYSYNKFYRFVLYCYTKVVLSLFGTTTKYKGIELLPKDTNFLIVSNHISNVDSFIMDVYLKKYPLVFVTKKSLFSIPFFGKIIRAIGYLLMDRSDQRSEQHTIQKGINILNEGKVSVAVYPEGTRNFTDDIILPFKSGCFHLAKDSHRPIVVSCTRGTEKIRENILFKKHPITFYILRVISYEEYKNLNTQEISDLVRNILVEELKKPF